MIYTCLYMFIGHGLYIYLLILMRNWSRVSDGHQQSDAPPGV